MENWKTSPYVEDYMTKLNTLFELAEKAEVDVTLEVKSEAIDVRGDDFVRILPQEAAIYGREQGDSWIFKIPPVLLNPGHDKYVLSASSASGRPTLLYYHMHHGGIAIFRPSDIVSITLD